MVSDKAQEIYLRFVEKRIYQIASNGRVLGSDELAVRIRQTPKRAFGVRYLNIVKHNTDFFELVVDGEVLEAILGKAQGNLFYADHDDCYLEQNWRYGLERLASEFYVSIFAIRSRMFRKKIKHPVLSKRIWVFEEDQILRDYPRMTDKEVGKLLGRTEWAVKNHRSKLGFRRKKYGDWKMKNRFAD